jgi:trans-aconitate methyltransferase
VPRSIAAIRGNDTGYLAFHAPRYRFVLELVDRYLPRGGRVLDIGLSPLTRLLRDHVGAPIDTLGLETASNVADGIHHQFDLNRLGDLDAVAPTLTAYDIIVCAEVIEHLYTSPYTILRFLHRALVPNGILIVQTPNAASLFKRVRLVLGVHPYEMLRETRSTNPGHYREYTVSELQAIARGTGFDVIDMERRYYFDARFADMDDAGRGRKPRPLIGAIKNVVYGALPPFLREGVTLVLRKSAAR